ncbi:ATP-binding protein [Nonomuraea wenchangensis]
MPQVLRPRAPALPDRRFGHRQVPPAHRPGHRGHDGRLPRPLHPGDQAPSTSSATCNSTAAAPSRLFQVLTEREEKASVAIASNESFGGWTKTFTDPRLCAAIVDRLTFGGNIIATGTDSYRPAATRAAQQH